MVVHCGACSRDYAELVHYKAYSGVGCRNFASFAVESVTGEYRCVSGFYVGRFASQHQLYGSGCRLVCVAAAFTSVLIAYDFDFAGVVFDFPCGVVVRLKLHLSALSQFVYAQTFIISPSCPG